MKQVKIYFRSVTARTEYRAYRWKEEKQIVVEYDGKMYANSDVFPTNPKLKKSFKIIYASRSKTLLKGYINDLGRDNASKWLKESLIKILEGTI